MKPLVVAFLCNWCSYAGADLAGVSRYQYPPNIRIVRVMCTGRIDPLFILKAFQCGADAVLIAGCHPGDCHYIKGNLFAKKRFKVMKSLFEYIGIDTRRLQMVWISASEGTKFADTAKSIVNDITQLKFQDNIRRISKN
jgi:coenzyme F420-reducing hydrogenase delta subunit